VPRQAGIDSASLDDGERRTLERFLACSARDSAAIWSPRGSTGRAPAASRLTAARERFANAADDLDRGHLAGAAAVAAMLDA
jgi:hypothetical protein